MSYAPVPAAEPVYDVPYSSPASAAYARKGWKECCVPGCKVWCPEEEPFAYDEVECCDMYRRQWAWRWGNLILFSIDFVFGLMCSLGQFGALSNIEWWYNGMWVNNLYTWGYLMNLVIYTLELIFLISHFDCFPCHAMILRLNPVFSLLYQGGKALSVISTIGRSYAVHQPLPGAGNASQTLANGAFALDNWVIALQWAAPVQALLFLGALTVVSRKRHWTYAAVALRASWITVSSGFTLSMWGNCVSSHLSPLTYIIMNWLGVSWSVVIIIVGACWVFIGGCCPQRILGGFGVWSPTLPLVGFYCFLFSYLGFELKDLEWSVNYAPGYTKHNLIVEGVTTGPHPLPPRQCMDAAGGLTPCATTADLDAFKWTILSLAIVFFLLAVGLMVVLSKEIGVIFKSFAACGGFKCAPCRHQCGPVCYKPSPNYVYGEGYLYKEEAIVDANVKYGDVPPAY